MLDNSRNTMTRNTNNQSYQNIQQAKEKTIPARRGNLCTNNLNRFKQEQIQLAKWNTAVTYLSKMTYRKIREVDGEVKYYKFQLFESNHEFRQYGLGVYFYLEFMKAVGFLFLFCTIVAGVQISYNFAGTGLSSYPTSYIMTLLYSSLGNNTDPSATQLQIQTMCDLIYTVFVLLFIVFWRFRTSAIIQQNIQDLNLLNPQKYTISIGGIAQSTDTNEIKQFIEKAFNVKIYEVSIVYDFKRKFQDFVTYDQLNTELEMQKLSVIQNNEGNEDVKKIQQKINKLEQKLLKGDIEPIALSFIIHFQTISDKVLMIKSLQYYNMIDQWSYTFPKLICCACCFHQVPQEMKFQGKEEIFLKQRQLGRPEYIIWENLDIQRLQKWYKTLIGTILIIALLIICSITIAACSVYVSSSNSCTTYNSATTLSQASASTDSNLIYCFCQANIVNIFTDININALCKSLQQKIILSQILQIVAALISTFTNIILTLLINLIVTYMRPKSKSQGHLTSFVYILFATIVNSITLPLLLNASIFGHKPILFLKFINFLSFSNLTSYGDFTRTWYAAVAPYYVNFFLIGILNPWINLIKTIIFEKIKRYRLRQKQDKIIQKLMNQQISDFEFDLPVASAAIMLYISFAFVYSSCLPILMPLCILIIISHYISNKYIIIRYSKQIPINEDINLYLIKFFPYILIVHIAFGIWSYTCPDIFPSTAFSNTRLNISIFGDAIDRIFNINYLTLILVVVIVGIILDATLISFINWLCACCSSTQVHVQNPGKPQQQYQKRLQSVNILGSYNIENNTKYQYIIKMMKKLFRQGSQQKIITQEQLIGNQIEQNQMDQSGENIQIKRVKKY